MRRESQLIADDRGMFIVPGVITHCSISPSHTHLHSPSGQLILDEEVILCLVDGDVELCQITYSKSHIKICACGCKPETEIFAVILTEEAEQKELVLYGYLIHFAALSSRYIYTSRSSYGELYRGFKFHSQLR